MRHLHTVEIPGQYPVTLELRASGGFRVIYGKEIHDRLSYNEAARHFGESVLHALACDGQLNNGRGLLP